MTTLLLHNASVLTMDPARPRASAVLVRDDRIAAVGGVDITPTPRRGLRTLDCRGAMLVPGFHDAHLHLLGLASRLLAVDCSSSRSIPELAATIRSASANVPAGRWLRSWGYHETALAERRHPTRADLDAAAPDHLLILAHRSGHAHVLNSAALRAAGITGSTPDPDDGVIARDEHGVPTGLLFEMGAWLDRRVPRLSDAELRNGVRKANRLLLSRGVTTIHDATPANNLARWELFQRLAADGVLTVRCVFMPGIDQVSAFVDAGLAYGAGNHRLSVGAAKMMLTTTTGALYPSSDVLPAHASAAAAAGFPVAIHAVEAEAVAAASEVIVAVRGLRPGLRHRIEHASECPPHVLEAVRRSGAVVVTNPGFIHHSGDRYLAEVAKDLQPWLYRIGALHRAGVTVAFGSDAPVELPDPIVQVSAAVTRRSSSGQAVGEFEAVNMETALRMHTVAGSHASGLETRSGVIAPDMPADLVLLDGDPLRASPDALMGMRILKTLVGGEESDS